MHTLTNNMRVSSDSLICLQVAVHQLMKKHYHSHAQTAFPPIPSVPITVPVSSLTLQVLCYKARYESERSAAVTPAALQHTVAALLKAAQQLDQDSNVRDIQTAQQDRTGKAERRCLLKRNGSKCSRQMLKFTLHAVAHGHTTTQTVNTAVCPALSGSPLVPPWLQQHNESYSRYGLQPAALAWYMCVRLLSQLETKVLIDPVFWE